MSVKFFIFQNIGSLCHIKSAINFHPDWSYESHLLDKRVRPTC